MYRPSLLRPSLLHPSTAYFGAHNVHQNGKVSEMITRTCGVCAICMHHLTTKVRPMSIHVPENKYEKKTLKNMSSFWSWWHSEQKLIMVMQWAASDHGDTVRSFWSWWHKWAEADHGDTVSSICRCIMDYLLWNNRQIIYS